MKIALCLLTWNEINGCKNDVPFINKDGFDEVYCIDAGSDDGTIEFLEANNIPVFIQPIKGYNQAYKYAIEKCSCDTIIFFHPKGTIDVADTLKFKEYFINGYDIVIASRMIKYASNEEDDRVFRPRKWFVKTLGLMSYLIFKRKGKIIWDVLHGFRGGTVSALKTINILDGGLTADIEMIVKGYKNNLKMIEFPVKENSRQFGETHFKAFSTGKLLLEYLVSEIMKKNKS